MGNAVAILRAMKLEQGILDFAFFWLGVIAGYALGIGLVWMFFVLAFVGLVLDELVGGIK